MLQPPHSITVWIDRLRASDPQAAQELWQRFFTRMVEVARRRLAVGPRRVADEEDAALAAFLAFQRGIAGGRFPDLNNRDDLWALLFTLTVRAAGAQLRHERRLRRGGGDVRGDSALLGQDGERLEPADDRPGQDEEVAFQDELRHALDRLGDDHLRRVALARLEGCTIDEVAERLGCAAITIRRRLALIRLIWEEFIDEARENPRPADRSGSQVDIQG